MRRTSWIFFAIGLLAGCGDSDRCLYNGKEYAIGDNVPTSDGCGCVCTKSGVECDGGCAMNPFDACTSAACSDASVDACSGGCSDAKTDAEVAACEPGGGCASGPACGILCCGEGERCESGTCHCGTGAACGVGDHCASSGPSSGGSCGTLCCGQSGPCPQ